MQLIIYNDEMRKYDYFMNACYDTVMIEDTKLSVPYFSINNKKKPRK